MTYESALLRQTLMKFRQYKLKNTTKPSPIEKVLDQFWQGKPIKLYVREVEKKDKK